MRRSIEFGWGARVLLALFVSGLLLTASIVWMDHASEKGERIGSRMTEEAERVAADGARACVLHGLRRSRQCGYFDARCPGVVEGFTRLCLKTADPPPAFCSDVPLFKVQREVEEWTTAECAELGYADDKKCATFLALRVISFCESR